MQGPGDTVMGRGMARSAEWLMGKRPSQAAADRVQAATAAQEQSYGPEQVETPCIVRSCLDCY